MGIIDSALSGFGLERSNQTPRPPESNASDIAVTKSNDLSTGAGAWHDIFGGGKGGSNFTQFNNMKEQLASYSDWVYAAAHTISEQCAAIDLRIFVNRSEASSSQLGHKMVYDKDTILKMKQRKTPGITNVKGKLVKKDQLPLLEEVEAHPLLTLLNSPNPFMTGSEFFEMTFLHLELTGNAFWAVERDKKGKPSALWPLMPQFVKVVPDAEKFIIGYTYNVNNEEVPFAPDDIIHHKYSNPNDLRMGTSTVQAAARAIDTDSHAADYNRKFFYNSAQPDAVLYTDSEVDDKMYKRLVSQWRDSYGGTANSHRTAILENGLKYQPRVLTQKDMDFLAGRNFNRDMILAIFGVPKSIIGLDESMSRANAETAEYVFVKGKIRPKMLRLCARITEDLAIQYDQKLVVSFTDPVPSDKEFVLKAKTAAVNTWRTVNEIRAEDGDDPIPGGDKVYVANTIHAIGEEMWEPAPESRPAVAEEDPKKPNEEDDSQDSNDDKKKPSAPDNVAPPADAGSTSGDNAKSAQDSKKKDSNPKIIHQVEDKISVKDFQTTRNDLSDKYEVQFLRASKNQFDSQRKEVLENLKERFGKSYKPSKRKASQQQKNNLNNLYDAQKSQNQWVDALVPIYAVAISQMGDKAMEYAVQLADENELTLQATTYDSTAPGVAAFYEERTTSVAAGIDAETDKQLKTSLSEGISSGEGIPELANRVESIFSAAAGYRAERIARTESIMATTWATRDAWRASGVVSATEWITGGNPCGFCKSMAGQQLSIATGNNYFALGESLTLEDGQSMSFTYTSIQGPPLHVNCACSLIPILMS